MSAFSCAFWRVSYGLLLPPRGSTSLKALVFSASTISASVTGAVILGVGLTEGIGSSGSSVVCSVVSPSVGACVVLAGCSAAVSFSSGEGMVATVSSFGFWVSSVASACGSVAWASGCSAWFSCAWSFARAIGIGLGSESESLT